MPSSDDEHTWRQRQLHDELLVGLFGLVIVTVMNVVLRRRSTQKLHVPPRNRLVDRPNLDPLVRVALFPQAKTRRCDRPTRLGLPPVSNRSVK